MSQFQKFHTEAVDNLKKATTTTEDLARRTQEATKHAATVFTQAVHHVAQGNINTPVTNSTVSVPLDIAQEISNMKALLTKQNNFVTKEVNMVINNQSACTTSLQNDFEQRLDYLATLIANLSVQVTSIETALKAVTMKPITTSINSTTSSNIRNLLSRNKSKNSNNNSSKNTTPAPVVEVAPLLTVVESTPEVVPTPVLVEPTPESVPAPVTE
jgi:uncharacterized protein YeeX (DUF496 family)